MKAIHFILFLSFGLLSFPVYSDAQQPFLLNNNAVQGIQTRFIVVQMSDSDTAAIRAESQNLIHTLGSEGYFQASIDSIVAIDEMSAHLYFTKGPRSTFIEITDDIRQNHCEHLIGEYYRSLDLRQCMNSIINFLNEDGYPFATVSISQIEQLSDTGVSVKLRVLPGDVVTLVSYEFIGVRSLNGQILQTIAGWKKPTRFNENLLEGAVSRLNRSEFIQSATYSGLMKSDSTYTAVFTITEIQSSNVDLLLGLEPKIENGYRLTGQGILQLNHIIVPASRLNLEFNRSGSSESKLGLLYDQYQIGQLPIGYGFSVELRQIDSTYLTISSKLSSKWRIDPIKSLELGLSYNKVTSSDSNQQLNQPNQNRFKISIGFNYQSINNRRVPTMGSSFSATLTTGIINITDDELDLETVRGYSVNQFELMYSRYFPLTHRLILVPSLGLLHTVQDVYYDVDRMRFGGTNSMRGFREDQFRLAGFSMSMLEGRWLVSTSSYLYTFLSGAYIWAPTELGTRNFQFNYSSIYSGGIGVSYRVRPGILNVTYALGSDDSWLNGKIHFGIKNSF